MKLTHTLSLIVLPFTAMAETVEMNGLDVYYEVHGDLASGETPVLLLHGGMGNFHSDFSNLLPPLAEQYPVIGIDQQGHGRTGGRDAAITLQSMREDTLAVLNALDVEQVHVIGFSMGGMLALELGVHTPERLATLTAISASQNIDGMRPEITELNRTPGAEPSPEALELLPTEEDFAKMQAGFANNPDGPEQFELTFTAMQTFMNSGWGWSNAELGRIMTPTLLVLGDTDFSPVEHLAAMADMIPDAQLAILPDTTHLTITQRADWLVPMVEARIGGVR
ncbi:MAG: alpha/beta fold hydrolase [Halomonas sp.]|uniref:alpha/beta fold hydrolase n=1 Tax=Halomonas sp. TaxID=1486246 RepID=UPI003F902941